jgi:hypothetical protein
MDLLLSCITTLRSGDGHLAGAASRTVDDGGICLEGGKGCGTLVDVPRRSVVDWSHWSRRLLLGREAHWGNLLLLGDVALLLVNDSGVGLLHGIWDDAFGLLRGILNRRGPISWGRVILMIHFESKNWCGPWY